MCGMCHRRPSPDLRGPSLSLDEGPAQRPLPAACGGHGDAAVSHHSPQQPQVPQNLSRSQGVLLDSGLSAEPLDRGHLRRKPTPGVAVSTNVRDGAEDARPELPSTSHPRSGRGQTSAETTSRLSSSLSCLARSALGRCSRKPTPCQPGASMPCVGLCLGELDRRRQPLEGALRPGVWSRGYQHRDERPGAVATCLPE